MAAANEPWYLQKQRRAPGLRCAAAEGSSNELAAKSFTFIKPHINTLAHPHTHTHTRGGGYSPDAPGPTPHRKPLHADTALRDAATMHYSPPLNTDSPFHSIYTVYVIHRASEGTQKCRAHG